ncbi:C-type mannose receptor 2-like [Glandiceps talaboti]
MIPTCSLEVLAQRCPAGWDMYNGRCFNAFNQGAILWSEAEDKCEELGGTLATVDTLDLNAFLMTLANLDSYEYWMGLHDIGNEGVFVWVDGTPYDSTQANWDSNQPDDYQNNEDCVHMWGNGRWNDRPCNETITGYFCQHAADVPIQCDEDDGWESVNDMCFKYVDLWTPWSAAREYCQALNADLVTIENEIVQEYLDGMSNLYQAVLWIGASDVISGTKGSFTWTDGSPLTYTNWKPYEPKTDQDENDFLVSQFENLRSAGISDIWIGASDIVNDGIFAWSDGTVGSISYSNWNSGEPSSVASQDDCASIYVENDNGLWDINNCYILQPFVCEIREGQAVVPYQPDTQYGVCPDGWALHGAYCYYFGSNQMTFADAELTCEGFGAALASIEDGTEESFLSGRMDNIRAWLWIGLNDRTTENSWEWVDGTQVTFINWADNEPNDYDTGEDCVVMEYNENIIGEWNDKPCDMMAGFVCKFPKEFGAPVTEVPKVTPSTDPRCGSGYEIDVSTTTCYKFAIDDYVDWPTAESICTKSGGHLLSIKDQTEQTFINARMYGLTASVFWMGANDRTYEGGWEWSDGTPFAFLNWADGEPNDYNHGETGEDCTEIIVSSGEWNDHRCDWAHGYVCENNGEIVENFNVYRNYILDGYDMTMYYNVLPQDCAKYCLNLMEYTCSSFDYDKVNMACNLSSFTKESSGVALRTDTGYDHYQVVTYPTPDVTTTLPPNSRCEYGWSSYGSYCYFAQNVAMSWQDARDVCRSDDAELVSIKDSNENSFVVSLVQKMCDAFHTASTDDQYVYKFITAPVENSRVTFEVKASNDVHIALSPNDYDSNPMYEVVIGGWSNTHSAIRRCGLCAEEVYVVTDNIVSATEFRAFWITFVNGKISVGKDGEPAFMEWTDPDPVDINYIGYTTGWGSNGEFILCTDHSEDYQIWHGLNDLRTPHTYEWVDLSEVTYTRWNNGEPNNYNGNDEDCCKLMDINYGLHVESNDSFWGSYAGYWNDESCQYVYKSVCKKAKEVLPATTQSSGECGTGWYVQGNSCYRFVSTAATWSDAETSCNNMMGNLVAINDNVEQAFVSSKLAVFGNGNWYWIGLTDISSPGQFTWSDGDPVTYTHWDVGQPDNSNGDCVGANTGSNAGLWTATSCDGAMPYICEKTRPGFTKAPVTVPYATNPSNVGCADGWLGYGSKCFLAISMVEAENRISWDEALLDCRNRGGDLASFHSDDELRYVKTNSKVINFLDEFWIGLNDRDSENGFVWTDGSPVNFVSWADGEPNNSDDEDCVEMTFAAPKGWNDRKCTRRKNWVCQIEKGVMPASTVAAATATISGNCGTDLSWVFSMGYCYYFSSVDNDGRKSWDKSRDFCMANAGDLVSVHSSLEQNFIATQMRDKQMITAWIGLREYSTGGSHVWSDKTALDYVNWDDNQPDDAYGSEKCVELLSTDGRWNDLNCGDAHTFVCKKTTSSTAPKTPEPTVLPPGNCPTGYMEYNNKCYSFNGQAYEDRVDWQTARSICNTQGGDLVSIHSQNIQSFLTSNLRDVSNPMWIGLNDEMTTGQYRWQDGSEVDYTNWAPNEPTGGFRNEGCVEMHLFGVGGEWNDLDCGNSVGYVCQTLKSTSNPAPVQPSTPCRAGYTYNWNGCYKLLSGSYAWNSAKEMCNKDEADLVSIEDMYEQAFIETYMFSLGGPIWIGLNDLEQTGSYSWSDGSPVFYTKWGFNEPSYATGEGCVRMNVNGGWDDTKCSETGGAVCKYYIGAKPTTPAPVTGYCNQGNSTSWTEYHNYCYNIDGIADTKNWAEAAFECDKIGGYIVTINDQDENNYIEKLISDNSMNVWLGLTRSDLGGFGWVDDTPLDYTNWGPGEPNNYNDMEDCGEMYYAGNVWNDVDCYGAAGYICKKQKHNGQPNQPSDPEQQSSGLSGGAIFGIILGVVLAVVAVLAVVYMLFIRNSDFSLPKMPTTSSSSGPPQSVGFDNSLYSTSTSVNVDDKVKLEFNDNIADA